jgi:amidase
MGRPFSDVRLVAFAYAFEQAGPRRRPPASTPALVHGRAPRPVTFTVRSGTTATGAYGTFTFDPLTSDLSFSVRVASAGAEQMQAVVIRRADGNGTRVIQRVMGPAMTNGSGHLRLTGADLAAFHAGRVTLAMFGPVAEVPLSAP